MLGEMVMNTAKRLTPKKDVVRELYLKSGNQCAFPGCTHLMMNAEGEFIGEMCHIEAAEPGGERFNPNMTNEERRAFSNLVLLCHKHHVITNNVDKYPVKVLQKMKGDHESKFADIVSKLQNSISDITQLQEHTYTKLCTKLDDCLDWGNNQQELKECSDEINEWVDKLKKLPPDTLNVFCIMIARSTPSYFGNKVILHEIEKVTGNPEEVKKHYDLLLKYRFLSEAEHDYDLNTYVVFIQKFDSGWDFWNDLRDFCNATSIALEEFIVQLNFARLD